MPAANAGEAITIRLIASATVGAVVADRVYPIKPTQDATWPYIVVQITQGGGDNRMAGQCTTQMYTIRVECYAKTIISARAIMKIVKTSLNAWRDLTELVLGTFPVGDTDEHPLEDGTYFAGQSFSIFYKG